MSRTNLKRYLMLLAVIGLVAIASGGGSGTFASFNAEVANQGNYFATGTLLLHDTHGATTCTSESASDNLNVSNTGDTCSALFTVNLTSSTGTTYAALTLKNAGTLDASNISFKSPGCTSAAQLLSNTTLNGAITTGGGALTSLTVNAVTLGIQSGATVTVTDGVNTDTFTTTAAVPAGATSIPVSSHTPAFNFANASAVKTAPSFGAGNLCTGLETGIIETDSSLLPANALGCDYGNVSGVTCSFTTTPNLNTWPSTLTNLNLVSGASGNTGTQLNAGGSRYFLIAVTPPAGGLDNTYQNKKATFSLIWHIDQA